MPTTQSTELTDLLENWTDNENRTKAAFLAFKESVETKDGVTFEFVARPGITFSLRISHTNQKNRPLFAMVDIIDDDPTDRWLSVCFYRELINDPDACGDEVPEGLLGEDACCFDVDQDDPKLVEYVKARLHEAWENAARQA